jgi:hypothetical protein
MLMIRGLYTMLGRQTDKMTDGDNTKIHMQLVEFPLYQLKLQWVRFKL